MMRPLYNRYIGFFALVFALFCLEPITLLSNAETAHMVFPLARFLGICFAILVGCLWFSSIISRNTFLATLAALLTGSVISLKAAFHPLISGLSVEFFLFLSLVLFALIYSVASHLFRLEKKPNLVTFFWVVIIGISSPAFIFMNSSSSFKKSDNEIVQSLILSEKPNIYLLSYDSLIPQTIVQEYLHSNIAPYQNILDNQFSEYPLSLSFHV